MSMSTSALINNWLLRLDLALSTMIQSSTKAMIRSGGYEYKYFCSHEQLFDMI
jgi:hypothetical protein